MPVDKTLYEILGVSPNASSSEIKKAYYHLAKKFHPDKNADHGDKFKEISFAYDVLANEDKKRVYDSRGLDGLKEGAASGGYEGFEDILGKLFGGGIGGGLGGGFFSSPFGFGGQQRRQQKQRSQDMQIPLPVTLEDLYKGGTKTVEFSPKIVCKGCDGRGGPPGAVRKCPKCKGAGIYLETRRIGPGMIQQMQSHCRDCMGEGDIVREEDKCKRCQGKKVVEEKRKMEVQITPGMENRAMIPLRGKGHHMPDTEPGDVVVVLCQEDHDVFTRRREDLLMKMEINLTESLCGFKIPVKHVDGRVLMICHPPGDPITPKSLRLVVGEGMVNGQTGEHGNLIIVFDVLFPESNEMTESQIKRIEKYLPSKPTIIIPNEDEVKEGIEEVQMVEFDTTRGHRNTHHQHATMSDDEDSHQHPGMRVQECQTS